MPLHNWLPAIFFSTVTLVTLGLYEDWLPAKPMAPLTEDKLEGPRPAKVLYANSRVAKSCGKAAVLERGYLHAT